MSTIYQSQLMDMLPPGINPRELEELMEIETELLTEKIPLGVQSDKQAYDYTNALFLHALGMQATLTGIPINNKVSSKNYGKSSAKNHAVVKSVRNAFIQELCHPVNAKIRAAAARHADALADIDSIVEIDESNAMQVKFRDQVLTEKCSETKQELFSILRMMVQFQAGK